jgi:hypothetical protein
MEETKDLPMDSKLDELLALVRGIDTRLTTLEEKVDSRLTETRPIWEGVLARLETLSAEVSEFRTEVSEFREETAKNFELVDSKFNIINDHILNVQAKQRLTEKRVEDLERKAS